MITEHLARAGRPAQAAPAPLLAAVGPAVAARARAIAAPLVDRALAALLDAADRDPDLFRDRPVPPDVVERRIDPGAWSCTAVVQLAPRAELDTWPDRFLRLVVEAAAEGLRDEGLDILGYRTGSGDLLAWIHSAAVADALRDGVL